MRGIWWLAEGIVWLWHGVGTGYIVLGRDVLIIQYCTVVWWIGRFV